MLGFVESVEQNKYRKPFFEFYNRILYLVVLFKNMQLLQKIFNKLNGLYYRQEYLCLAKESLPDRLHMYLVAETKVIKDITNHHLFIGYSPLVFAFFPGPEMVLSQIDNVKIVFAQRDLDPVEILDKRDVLASIYLRKVPIQFAGCHEVYFYEGTSASHRLLNSFHQFVVQLGNDLYNNKPGNVFLRGNLYKQVQLAYAIPRTISLISVRQNDLFNLFPTDLHGPIADGHYIISLRRGGKAGQQVETVKKILVSEVLLSSYKFVYSLGKNHMQELKDKSQFLFGDKFSATFQLPLPQFASYYRELELLDSVDHGIHRFFLFRIIHQCRIQAAAQTLAHVHNVYASWRRNKGLSGNYLLR
jgi:hypothetical protein